MRKIYKYQLPFHKNTVLKLPKNWEAVAWQLQNGVPTLWAIIDANETETVGIEFVWVGTGDHVPYSFAYQCTLQEPETPFVWHLFINTFYYNPQA